MAGNDQPDQRRGPLIGADHAGRTVTKGLPMQQPPTSPRPVSRAARPPGTLLRSRHQPAGAPAIHPCAARRATALVLNAGLIPENGNCFPAPGAGAEKQGKRGDSAMMPFSRPVPPVPPGAGTTAGTG